MAYLLGRREFWSLRFEVTPAVLVPRPETNCWSSARWRECPAPRAVIADLGTGSGCIAIALAHERPDWTLTGTDASVDATGRGAPQWTRPRRRSRRRGCTATWFEPLARQRFDALVRNPPYIAADDPVLAGDSLSHEPRVALTPGGDGLGALATLINGAPGHLEPGGWLLLRTTAPPRPKRCAPRLWREASLT